MDNKIQEKYVFVLEHGQYVAVDCVLYPLKTDGHSLTYKPRDEPISVKAVDGNLLKSSIEGTTHEKMNHALELVHSMSQIKGLPGDMQQKLQYSFEAMKEFTQEARHVDAKILETQLLAGFVKKNVSATIYEQLVTRSKEEYPEFMHQVLQGQCDEDFPNQLADEKNLETERTVSQQNDYETRIKQEETTTLIIQIMARLAKSQLGRKFDEVVRAKTSVKALESLKNLEIPISDVFGQEQTAHYLHLAFYCGLRSFMGDINTSHDRKTTRGFSPIHFVAANKEHDDSLWDSLKVDQQTLENTKANNGYTAVHIAAMVGNINFIKKLCGQCIDKPKTDYGICPIHVVKDTTLLDLTKKVSSIKDNRGWTLVHFAVQRGDTDMLKYLLSVDDNKLTMLRSKTTNGRNIAHIAAEYGQTEVLDWIKTNKERLANAKPKVDLLKDKDMSLQKPYQVADGGARTWFHNNGYVPWYEQPFYLL